ncbi:MAG: PadR family transcriptional regulator [Promethearchaeota archaeon]
MNIGMFDPLLGVVEYLREREATTPEKALTLSELGIPEEMEQLIPLVLPEMFPIIRVGNKYYLSEERFKQFRKQGGFISPIKKWIQHTAKVPKGFLRYQVLHKLNDHAMSGAELTETITEDMGGLWTPKPGSIYPLLKNLLQDGLTQEVPDEDGRTRRYELTEVGQKFLEDHVEQSGELREKINPGFTPFLPPFLPTYGSRAEFPKSIRHLFKTLLTLRTILRNNPSPELLKEVAKATDRFIKEIEKISKKAESQ